MTYPTGEVVSYAYDAGWRQTSLYSSTYSAYYANTASYTALDQPSSFTLGNGLSQAYSYSSLMQRLSSIQVGSGGSILNRGYTYDNVGNVATITGSPTIGTQTFTYDQRDRLTNWSATGINESYTYDLVGNITSKGGGAYSYSYNSQNYGHPAGGGGPYALRNGGYSYDANGNSLTEQIYSDQRAFTWNTENQPTQISFQGTTETYTYDADNSRIKKLRGTTTTHYIGGMNEEDVPTGRGSTVTRTMYTFNGQVIAQRTITSGGFGSNNLIYLHSDHLGSVGAATSSTGTSLSSQEYDPWGLVRTGGVTQSKYNYTGQKLDDTGLLFYNARYYDPLVGRFTSPDSIVPGASSGVGGAGGTVGGWQNSKLTVDFHKREFLSSAQGENVLVLGKGFWFQLSGQDQQKFDPSGPNNPQALNRYSYVLNNPIHYVDPTGHKVDSPNNSKAADDEEEPDLRPLSDSEAKKIAKEYGYDSVEKFKEDWVGSDASKCDVYKDKKTGEIWIKKKNTPKGFAETPTNIFWSAQHGNASYSGGGQYLPPEDLYPAVITGGGLLIMVLLVCGGSPMARMSFAL
jgi:RHS repeat-associated protein